MTRTFSRNTAIFLVPALGLAYGLWWLSIGRTLSAWTILPLLVYGGLVLSTSLYLSVKHRTVAGLVTLPILFAVIHTCYGCGLLGEGMRQAGNRVHNSRARQRAKSKAAFLN